MSDEELFNLCKALRESRNEGWVPMKSTLDNQLVASELSHEVSDVRIGSLLDLIKEIILYPESTCNIVNDWLDEHDNLDNPDVEAKAETLRAMVS